MYLRRSDLIFPRTICLNRLASRSIFRTTVPLPPPLRVLEDRLRPAPFLEGLPRYFPWVFGLSPYAIQPDRQPCHNPTAGTFRGSRMPQHPRPGRINDPTAFQMEKI